MQYADVFTAFEESKIKKDNLVEKKQLNEQHFVNIADGFYYRAFLGTGKSYTEILNKIKKAREEKSLK